VSSNKHLSEDALLLLASGNCPQEQRQPATSHLQTCDRCRQEYGQTRRILGAVEEASERGLVALSRVPQWIGSSRNRQKSRFPWAPVIAIVGVSLTVIFILLVPGTIPAASATELLDRAVASEQRFGSPQAYTVIAGGTRCSHTSGAFESLPAGSSRQCAKIRDSMRGTPWGATNPLTASAFRSWRASLLSRKDTVRRLAAVWTLETSTSSGPVRDARLTLRRDTYRPVGLYLHFSDEDEVTIEEDSGSITDNQAILKIPPPQRQAAVAARIQDPADAEEVEAWQILHNLRGDTGWEATVNRHGSTVTVEAEVLSGSRVQEFRDAYQALPKIVLNLHQYGDAGAAPSFLPPRGSEPGGAPPLADDWLQAHFPDPDQRSRFVNSAVDLSKAILGRAYLLDKLEARRRALSDCSCAQSMDALIEDQRTKLRAAEQSLTTSLEPLIGTPHRIQPPKISVAQAEGLDGAITKLLFTTSAEDSATLDEEEHRLSKLL
jgi:hypothetical protein